MVVNLRLTPRRELVPGADTMGRHWYGYDPSCTDGELWEHNRGRYAFATEAIEAESFATLSFRGEVLVVAELRHPVWETFEDLERGVTKKALIGDVLGPGNPVWETLIRHRIEPFRTPFTYLDDEEIGLSAAIEQWAVLRALGGGEGPDGPYLGDPPGRAAQGWETDPLVRKEVEDAAQDRLMWLFRDDGWEVIDTRHSRPFDAIARREGPNGPEVRYLEAKGTRTAGEAVLVTAGEIEHAREHPGQCVMGVLSDIRLRPDGHVDPDSGTFRTLRFEPEPADLEPTTYRWRLPGE